VAALVLCCDFGAAAVYARVVVVSPEENGMIELNYPWFLLLFLLLGVLPVALRRSLAGMTGPQRFTCTAIRAIILSLLILALAGVRWRMRSGDLSVLYVVDDSASLTPEAREQARDFVRRSALTSASGDRIGVVGFARTPKIWQALQSNFAISKRWVECEDRSGTRIAEALKFASAVFPVESAKRIILLSDGNDTGEGTLEAAESLGASGIEIFPVPLNNAKNPEVLVESVEVPRQLKNGQAFDLIGKVRSNIETVGQVKVYRNQFLVGEKTVNLNRGSQEVVFPDMTAEGNFAAFEIEVVPKEDSLLENNRAQATASLRGEPRVLLIDPDEQKLRPLASALEAEKIKTEVRSLKGLPVSIEDLQQFDLFMLSDVSALNLSREQMELYRRWVREFGGGFLMLGGENSFGVGGYFRTPVEQMLPVRMEHEDRQDTPTVALLVVLDRSGSMSAQVQGQTKMALANQGAVFALQVLQPKDLFGLLAVDSRAHDVVPLGRIQNKAPLEQKILSISAGGGGIYVYTSLAEAFRQLREVNARIKHVILFSDAKDAEEKNAGDMGDGTRVGGSSLDLATAMLANSITTSVVALGFEQDKDTAFLKQLAERGNGRFYLTNDAMNLPKIFSTETMKVAQSSLIEEPFVAVPVAGGGAIEGLDWQQAPLLLGYNSTRPKPTADILLATERGEPLYATWRYGLGQVAAFTSDAKSRWASEWLGWNGFGKFWTQVVRSLMRRSDQADFQVTATERGDNLHLIIEAATLTGLFRNQLPISVTARDGETGRTVTKEAEQSAPGTYEVNFELPERGTTMLSVSSSNLPESDYVFGYTRSYPKEFFSTETNEALLRAIATRGKGRYDPAFNEIFERSGIGSLRRVDLSSWFLVAALILFPLDIWFRRRAWTS
jgi:Ca-activated chloride channel family protein